MTTAWVFVLLVFGMEENFLSWLNIACLLDIEKKIPCRHVVDDLIYLLLKQYLKEAVLKLHDRDAVCLSLLSLLWFCEKSCMLWQIYKALWSIFVYTYTVFIGPPCLSTHFSSQPCIVKLPKSFQGWLLTMKSTLQVIQVIKNSFVLLYYIFFKKN